MSSNLPAGAEHDTRAPWNNERSEPSHYPSLSEFDLNKALEKFFSRNITEGCHLLYEIDCDDVYLNLLDSDGEFEDRHQIGVDHWDESWFETSNIVDACNSSDYPFPIEIL